MSDLEQLTSVPIADDPFDIRVLARKVTPELDFKALGSTGTSCSIISIDEVTNVVEQLEDVGDELMERVRGEIINMVDEGSRRQRSSGAQRSRRVPKPRTFTKPAGGRACVLSDAIDHCSNEFVVVAGRGSQPLSGLSGALGHMWIEGADIAVLSRTPYVGAFDSAQHDHAVAVPEWMGLVPRSGNAASGTTDETLIMRRWLARWIFNEIDRAIDPATEIADRIRLLGVTIVHLVVDEPDPDPGGLASAA